MATVASLSQVQVPLLEVGADDNPQIHEAATELGVCTRICVSERTPVQRLWLVLLIPPFVCLGFFVVPMSGSFGNVSQVLNFYSFSLWYQPVYIAFGYFVSVLFFGFAVQRFRTWVYLCLWFIAVASTTIYCLMLGPEGLQGNHTLNYYCQIWTSGLVFVAHLMSSMYLHFRSENNSITFLDRFINLEDERLIKFYGHVESKPTECDDPPTIVSFKFHHLPQFVLSFVLNVIGTASYFTCLYLAVQKFSGSRGDFAAQAQYYIAFQVTFFLLRFALIYVISQFRTNKFATYGNVSIVYMYTHHVFFFTFYRVLFASVSGVSEFAIISCVQVGTDLLVYIGLTTRPVHYVLRTAKLYVIYQWNKLKICIDQCCCCSGSDVSERQEETAMEYYRQRDDVDAREAERTASIQQNSEDSLVRVIALVSTYLCYLTVNFLLRFTPSIRIHYNASADSDFEKLQIYLVLTMIFKLLTTIVIESHLRIQRAGNLSIWSKWIAFSDNIEHLLVIVVVNLHITTDVFIPNLRMIFF